jgi:hypothetical protein
LIPTRFGSRAASVRTTLSGSGYPGGTRHEHPGDPGRGVEIDEARDGVRVDVPPTVAKRSDGGGYDAGERAWTVLTSLALQVAGCRRRRPAASRGANVRHR